MKNNLNFALATLGLFGFGKTDAQPKPNVIFILADDLGYNDLSYFRGMSQQSIDQPSTSQTPNIDELAKSGIAFTSFYCGSAVSSPSRASLLTGRNCTRVGIYNHLDDTTIVHLRKEEVTIAEMLKQSNYQTGHFGKWHLSKNNSNQPNLNQQGYDYEFHTFNNAIPSHKDPINFFRNGVPVGALKGYSCQLVVDEAIGWLQSNKQIQDPFYMDVWFNEPHEKCEAPDSLKDRHAYRKEYYGAIENLDIAVGRLMAYLKANNLEKNTIIMFSSDNGSEQRNSNKPLRGEKCFNYDGGVRVPFIISWPGQVPEGKISDFPGSFTDVLPTIAKFTSTVLPKNRKLDGEDISKVFTGKTPENYTRKTPIFFFRYMQDPILMLREGDWLLLGYDELLPYMDRYNAIKLAKLQPDPGRPPFSNWGYSPKHEAFRKSIEPHFFELYNIKNDMTEHNDVSKNHPDLVKKMKANMLKMKDEMMKEGGDWFSK